jgi:predicted O-methyltransferase YrrM
MKGLIVAEYPNWFNGSAKDYFEQHLVHLEKQENLNFLQVGVFTGDASIWLADNILTGKNSRLYDVDTWLGSDEDAHHVMDFADVERTYDAKVSGYENILKYKMDSATFFSKELGLFDFIYVDADHTAEGVYRDAMNSWQVLKPNGILAFDDYTWGDGLPDQSLAPRQGIDKFLDKYNGQYHLIHKGAQVWIRKNA